MPGEVEACRSGELVRWYYTPMMLPFSRHLTAACTIYDCMDELSAFAGASRELDDQRVAQETFVLWDLVHDRAHMRGDLPFDRTVKVSQTENLEKDKILQRMPHNLKTLEHLMEQNEKDFEDCRS